jgi:hypothetical protein
MTERKKSHLIYLDQEGHVWMQEYSIGGMHPKKAEFFCEVPYNDDPKWIVGKPNVSNTQFLTLSPFYPTQRLDVSVEINYEPKIMRNVNHPAFAGCVKYMPIHLLDFRPIPTYIPRAIYTIGLCHYGHQEPYKTVDVPGDDKLKAVQQGRELLKPSTIENVRYISHRPNDAYDTHYNKKPKLKI